MNMFTKFPYIFFLTCGMFLSSAHAIYLESTVLEVPSDAKFINENVLNDSKTLNLYNIKIFEIDKPGQNGEKWKLVKNGIILFSPLSFILEPQESRFFKIFYRGPDDDTERYFRVVLHETPMNIVNGREQGKISSIIPAIALDTVLIVRPRKLNLKFEVDEKKGTIRNIGNTFFKVIVHKNCDSNDDEATIRYILPHETWQSNEIKRTSRKFIVSLDKYIPISDQCDM